MSSHAVGFKTKVTPQMRKYFFAIGFPLKKETMWVSAPARPWIQPAFEEIKPEIGPMFERKFISALERYGMKFE